MELHGETLQEASEFANAICKKKRLTFVSPYNDEWVIAGQGTCGSEIVEALPEVDSVIVPVGGGGLLSGILLALRHHKSSVFALGVQSEWATKDLQTLTSNSSLRSVSIADGIAVKRLGTLTAPIIQEYADLMTTVSEHEIASAIVRFLELEKTVIEGAAAAAIAALEKDLLPDRCRNTVIVVSGSNIDMNILSRLLERDLGERGRLIKIAVSVPDRPGSLHTTTGIIAAHGANVLQVQHDRSFSRIPGNVAITLHLEVRDQEHGNELLDALANQGLTVRSLME